MRSFGARRVADNLNSTFNLCNSPSFSAEGMDDKVLGHTVPVNETIKRVDAVDTQVVDYGDDDDDNTQPVDFNEETQILGLGGETQIMDDYTDFAETQLLIVSDSETGCDSDGDGTSSTQLLDDTTHLNDIQIPDTIDKQVNDSENIYSKCNQHDGGGRAESLPSDSLGKVFTSVRTASLTASVNAENGCCSSKINNFGSKSRSINNDGLHTGERVNAENDLAKHDEIRFGNSNKNNVVRSLARKLFIEEDFAEGGSNSEPDLRIDEFSQLPNYDNDLAGLSYVDSQEPGELSQANALQFVDKLLQVNLLEPEEDVMRKHAVCKTVNPGSYKKGANSIARDANRKSNVASASIFEWDDKAEDEGGGEFFSKKRELLLENCHVSRKSCVTTKASIKLEAKANQPLRWILNEEQQNVPDAITGFHDPKSKWARSRKACKFNKIDMENNIENYTDPLASDELLASDAPPNAEPVEFLNVGIDTQMAAEVIEALSTTAMLVENSGSMADEGPMIVVDRRGTKNVSKKRKCAPKRAHTSDSEIVTRSQLKSAIELKHSRTSMSRSHQLMKELKVDSVKPRVLRSRSNANNISNYQKQESSDKELQNIDSMGAKNHVAEDLQINPSVPVKRQCLRKRESPLMSAQKNDQPIGLNNLNCINARLDNYREGRHSVDGAHTRKRKNRRNTASENPKGVNSVNPIITVESSLLDGSSDKGRDLYTTCDPEIVSAKNCHTLTTACEVAFGSVTRRTRSKRSSKSANASKLSLEEQGACSPAKEILIDEFVGGSCLKTSENPTDTTPINLKRSSKSANASKLSLEEQGACSPAKEILIDEFVGGSCLKTSENPTDTTPINLKRSGNAVSPIVMGDEYHTPASKKSLFLKKECYKLTDSKDYSSPFRVLRQRRDINNIRVLFSQHLDRDIVKQQKKILSHLGFCEASTILEATHFVADSFTRTRNMLEAIANAKLVVTHMWLESCGQANCVIDEKSYILRDTKKEKELGFNMPMSLARASRHPILKGRRVLLTPSIKPSKDVISSLVKAVHGQAIGRLCRSSSNNTKILDDLLILSCEEDYEICSPYLERGITAYSSELLLNGIITQRLEYERHRLFASHVQKTRSTLWLRTKGDKLLRVPRTK